MSKILSTICSIRYYSSIRDEQVGMVLFSLLKQDKNVGLPLLNVVLQFLQFLIKAKLTLPVFLIETPIFFFLLNFTRKKYKFFIHKKSI